MNKSLNENQLQWRHAVVDTCQKQAVKNLQEKGTIHNSFPPKYEEKIPTIWSNTKGICTLNYKKYLKTCKVARRNKINTRYPLINWTNHLSKIDSQEIILKRWDLEQKIQEGLMSIIQAQILDSLIMEQTNDEDEEKLKYHSENMENITYLLFKFTNYMGILPETKAVSLFNEKYMDSIKKVIKLNVPGIPQQIKNQHAKDLSLKAKAEALSEIQCCKLLNNNNTEPVCLIEETEFHRK